MRWAERLEQELGKQAHKQDRLELRAPQAGTVKDLATHTPGTVVGPGVIIMTLVPADELLRAEVWVSNQDVGFVHAGQDAKRKLTAFTFQKYGMLHGRVLRVSADAAEQQAAGGGTARADAQRAQPAAYKTVVEPEHPASRHGRPPLRARARNARYRRDQAREPYRPRISPLAGSKGVS